MTCSCCGGKLPLLEIWEITREYPEAMECPGHINGNTGRCGGFYADCLWHIDEKVDEDAPDETDSAG